MMPKNDRLADAGAGTLTISKYPVRGSFIGLQSYSRVNTPSARTVTIRPEKPSNKPAWLTFLSEHLTKFGAALVICSAPSTAIAQDDAALAASAELAKVAMECALLAATTAPGTKPYEDVDRLVAVALPNMNIVAAAMVARFKALPADDTTMGPFGPLMRTISPDFYVGMSFDQWSRDIQDLLAQKAPYDSAGTFEHWQASKQVAAEVEYVTRNCRLIGR